MEVQHQHPLPPGQFEIDTLPRFGLTPFANRFPTKLNDIRIAVIGSVANNIDLSTELQRLTRINQTSDFHCVTTWSCRDLTWSGYRFADVFETIIKPQAQPQPEANTVVFHGQDGYRVGLPLSDLLASDVLLADRLNDQPLSIENGAPIRLVAPAHYGYKNPKHLKRIEFLPAQRSYRSAAFKFMDHPRARVAYEERGTLFPGWLLRRIYRPLIHSTRKKFEAAMRRYTLATRSAGDPPES